MRKVLFLILLATAGLLTVLRPTSDETIRAARYPAYAAAREMPAPPADADAALLRSPRGGADLIDFYLSHLNYPYGVDLPVAVAEAVLADQSQRPDEGQYNPQKALGPWEHVGPTGIPVRGSSQQYSGRITDIRLIPGGGLRVSSAGGGIWERESGAWEPLSDNLPTLVIGSFDIDPADRKKMVVATGDVTGNGLGVFRTPDEGGSWVPATTGPPGSRFYRLRFAPWAEAPARVHVASSGGYSRSDDAGDTWNRYLDGWCTSIAFDPAVSGTMYAGCRFDGTGRATGGIYKSTDGGDTWGRLTSPAIPPGDDIELVTLDVCASDPEQIWALISRPDTDGKPIVDTLIRSRNGGGNWETVGLPGGFDGKQGTYNSVMAVAPDNAEHVLIGAVRLRRSTNGGSGWSGDLDVHADQHLAVWVPGTNEIWLGNDGGLYHSATRGADWGSSWNNLPITQFTDIAVCRDDPDFVVGGSQDNGLSRSLGAAWEVFATGDGGGVALADGDCDLGVAAVGVRPSGRAFHRVETTNAFAGTGDFEGGIDETDAWYPPLRWPRAAGYIYTAAGPHVYRTPDFHTDWSKLNASPFPSPIWQLAVDDAGVAVYVTLNKSTYGGRIQVWQDGTWYDRDSPILPAGLIQRIQPHPTLGHLGVAYMITANAASAAPGGRVFRTDDFGDNWIDISGSLGRVLPVDVTGHPTDPSQVYVGTKLGMVWTPNGGTDWFNANDGAPAGNHYADLYLAPDPDGAPGDYWMYAGTYGRGVWRRHITTGVAGEPDPNNTTAWALPSVRNGQVTVLTHPDGTGESLASRLATISVQVLDASFVPVPGLDPARLTLNDFSPGCSAVTADAPTDGAGWTSFSGPLPWGTYSYSVQVRLDGAAVGSPIQLRTVSSDIGGDLRVDIDDLVRYSLIESSGYGVRADLVPDGVLDAADEAVLREAILAPKSCPFAPPVLAAAQGQLGVWFDAAGTQFGAILERGDEFTLHVIARGLTEPMLAVEFALPNLTHPAVEVLSMDWQLPVISPTITSGGELMAVFAPDCVSATELEIVRIRCRLRSWAGALGFCPEPLAAPSFGTPTLPGVPGWLGCNEPAPKHPFTDFTCASVNPFPLALYRGLQHQALGSASLLPQAQGFVIKGLDSILGGGTTIYFGGRRPGSKAVGGVPDPAGVDGAGIVFATALPAANLADGAFLELAFEDAAQATVASVTGTVSNGQWAMQAALAGAGTGPVTLELRSDGQTVLTDPAFTGTWIASEGLPSRFATGAAGGELILSQQWDQPISVTYGGQPYSPDEIMLTSQSGGTVPGLLIDTGTVNGGLLPDLNVVDEGILRFGHFFTGADNVFLGSEATALRLLWTDATAPGRVRAENVFDDAVDLFLGRPAPGVPDPVVSIVFSSGDQTGPGTMGLELRSGSTAAVLGIDVTGVGAGGWLARGFLAGQQQWEVAGSGSALGESTAWPIRTRMTQDALEVLWAAPVDLDPAGGAGQNLAAVDRLEIVPVQPTLPLPTGKTADLSFTGTSELVIHADPVPSGTPLPTPPTGALLTNVPNPFNPSTELRYVLARPGPVRLAVYDLHGRRVRLLLDEPRPAGAGAVTWDGTDDHGQRVASGVYNALLEAGPVRESRKLVLLK